MRCEVEDTSFFYETRGAGRPIVMLPGRPSDHRIMEQFMEPLFTNRSDWLRIYPDLPGTGKTAASDRLTTYDQLLDLLLAFIDALLPDQHYVLAGYSAGGYLAQGIVARRAASLDGLLLCAPGMKADESQARRPPQTTIVENQEVLDALDPDFVPLVKDLVVVQSRAVTDALIDVLSGPDEEAPDMAFNQRLDKAAPASFETNGIEKVVSFPTLLLTARQDHLCGYRDAFDLLETFDRATFAVLDRAGHFLGFEQANLAHALMGEWLDRVEEYVARRSGSSR
ncbi:MAG TPA: alpha/beta hydrolase [Ktedonosporobacter sp.]|nr:alpha/beta hydrolase [Ktedonosporobacter sp.]